MKRQIWVVYGNSDEQRKVIFNCLKPLQNEIDFLWIEKESVEHPYVVSRYGTFGQDELNVLVSLCSNRGDGL